MFLNDPLGLTLVDRYNCFRQNQKLIVLWVRLPQACPDRMLLILNVMDKTVNRVGGSNETQKSFNHRRLSSFISSAGHYGH